MHPLHPELYAHLYNAARELQIGIAWPALQRYLDSVRANYSGHPEDELLQVFRELHTLPSNLPPSPAATSAASQDPSSNCEDHSPDSPDTLQTNEPELFIYPVSTRPDTQKFQGLPSLHKEPTEDEGEGYISHPFCKTWCGEREAEERVEFSFRWTKDGALQTKTLPVRRFEESRADVVFPRDKPKEEISLQAVHDVPRFDQTTDLDLTFQNDKEKDWFASTSDDPDFIDWHKSGFGPAFAAAYSQGQADDSEWPKTFMLQQWRCWTIARNPPRPVPRPVLEPD